jgi:hypothetical protein
MPAHVQKMEKDFMHMAFETGNSVFTPPIVKMPQSFSRFGREATQAKDMGVAVPGDYYMGGVSAFAGGRTNFYPRGNLSTLSFQPVSNMQAPKRDYDQHWETGGPNGWRCKVQEKQSNMPLAQAAQGGGNGGGSGGGSGGVSPAMARIHARVMQQRAPMGFAAATPAATGNGSSSSSGGGSQQQQQQQKDYTEFSFDKDGQAIVQSKDRKHYLKVNQKDKKIMLTGDGDSTMFGKKNAYLNSGGLCVVNPSAQSEESGAGWDEQEQGGQGQQGSQSSGGGSTGVAAAGRMISSAPGMISMPYAVIARARAEALAYAQRNTPVVTPFANGGGGGGGGGNKVYLGGDPQKDKFCLVQTVCGPSKNVYAKI